VLLVGAFATLVWVPDRVTAVMPADAAGRSLSLANADGLPEV
jgi:hypothetical protein